MPVSLAYFAAYLRKLGHEIQVIDAFAEEPMQARIEGDFIIRGLTTVQVAERIHSRTKVIVVYAINLTYHRALLSIVRECKRCYPRIPIVVMENTQAVTAYSLRRVQEELFSSGVDYILTGEAEERGSELIEAILQKREPGEIDGVGYMRMGQPQYTAPARIIDDLDALPFPAWDLFPLANYWVLSYAHGPLETGSYLPLLTSRGCPYPCRFCVIPETNNLKWRGRSAKHVVDEIELYSKTFGVKEFHVEDVNPTVSDKRTREICDEIIARKLDVIWKIAAGTKVETLRDEKTIELMARAGCRYISISPESGSPRVLKMINKPFRVEHAVSLVKRMNEVGIYSQACFVLGFPGEEDEDRRMTWNLVRNLVKAGLDEIALFIITPVPGSDIYQEFSGYNDYSQLNFSPMWRSDYRELNAFRLKLYLRFLFWKACYQPLKMAVHPFNLLHGSFRTKMEMTPYRAFKLKQLEIRTGIHSLLLGLGFTKI
jgi:radical SAM superfamily enzyme YgiQ (UPF0313 family)